MSSQLLGSLALLGGHLFDAPITRDVSGALMQRDRKSALLLENGGASDAGHKDDGAGKHTGGSGGGLGGRHVCVLFPLG